MDLATFERIRISMLSGFRVLGFDLETTGFDSSKHRIVQYAFIGSDVDETHITSEALVKPNMKIPPETTKIHGISDDDVKHAELFKEHVDNISKLIDRSILVGHNIERFDWPFLKMEYLRCGAEIPEPYAIIDTWILAKKFKISQYGKRSLGALCDKFGITLEKAHSADADAGATLILLWKIMEQYPEEFQIWWNELVKSSSD
ncbi:MAG: 3'-5' exonuclease [Candidatus Poseidoniales archaeon]|jgi:DNA polymerase-3 subunit epsilon|tara:strand:- start:349 stop:957 length:609 start_codon:yes stop_codon:yes gene_type:complete